VVPLYRIERHGHHHPLGTNKFIGRELCRRVAELEPVVVFPDYFFTQIPEARPIKKDKEALRLQDEFFRKTGI
jgi:creatinine amidohydrolase